jgi:hypothetical protein
LRAAASLRQASAPSCERICKEMLMAKKSKKDEMKKGGKKGK